MTDINFAEVIKALDTTALKNQIVKCNKNMAAIEEAKKADDKLTQAKELVKEYGAPYSESIKNEKLKVKFLLEELETRGERPDVDALS